MCAYDNLIVLCGKREISSCYDYLFCNLYCHLALDWLNLVELLYHLILCIISIMHKSLHFTSSNILSHCAASTLKPAFHITNQLEDIICTKSHTTSVCVSRD